MFILHYIYKPRINRIIESFVHGWNKHPLRSEKNWSPEQLWANGLMDRRNINLIEVAELHDIEPQHYEWYGMDWYAPNPSDDGLSTIEIEEVEIPFSEDTYESLLQIDPMENSMAYGIDLYIRALNVVSQ